MQNCTIWYQFFEDTKLAPSEAPQKQEKHPYQKQWLLRAGLQKGPNLRQHNKTPRTPRKSTSSLYLLAFQQPWLKPPAPRSRPRCQSSTRPILWKPRNSQYSNHRSLDAQGSTAMRKKEETMGPRPFKRWEAKIKIYFRAQQELASSLITSLGGFGLSKGRKKWFQTNVFSSRR